MRPPAPIRQVETQWLDLELISRPYEAYVEAMRRQTEILEDRRRWTSRREVAKADRECDRLLKVIRSYYALRDEQQPGCGWRAA